VCLTLLTTGIAAVYATLLDEGQYHCSIRTMYRLLKQRGESRERRDQLIHPPYKKPELMTTAPNQLWSWDITKLLNPYSESQFRTMKYQPEFPDRFGTFRTVVPSVRGFFVGTTKSTVTPAWAC